MTKPTDGFNATEISRRNDEAAREEMLLHCAHWPAVTVDGYYTAECRLCGAVVESERSVNKQERMLMRVKKTGRTWSVVDASGAIIEGGFFSRVAAEEALREAEDAAQDPPYRERTEPTE